MSNKRLLLSLPVLLAAATSLLGQNQSKPAAPGVRSAAPAQVPGQSIRSATTKNFWVGKARDGSTMGVWSQLNPDSSDNVVKFAISSNAITAISSRRNPDGKEIASAFTAVFLDPGKAGPDTILGFTHSVGPQNKEKVRAHGAFPVELPSGLTRELLELGTSARIVKDLESLVEAKSAAEAIAGAAFGGHSMRSATDDPFLKRRELPKDMRDSPTASLPGRDGRASGEGGGPPKEPGARPATTLVPLGAPQAGPVGPPRDPNAPETATGKVKAEHIARADARSDSDNLNSRADEVSPRRGSNSEPAPPHPSAAREDVVKHTDMELTITQTYSSGERRSFTVRPGAGTDPRRNPPEGGSLGINAWVWKVLRGTGMGVALYNDWLKKQNHDFLAPARQPPRDTQSGSSVREVPKVGRSAVVNPTEGGGRGGARPKIPDMKDPPKPEEGGGRPVPAPRP